MSDAQRLPALQQRGRIVKGFSAILIPIDKADEQGRPSNPFMKPVNRLDVLRNKTGLEDQILRRIPRDRQLGSQDKIGAGLIESLVRLDDLFEISLNVADGRIELSETDLHGFIALSPSLTLPLLGG